MVWLGSWCGAAEAEGGKINRCCLALEKSFLFLHHLSKVIFTVDSSQFRIIC